MTDSETALARLKSDFPETIFRDPANGYLVEPRGQHQGQALAVMAPRDTDEVARIVRFALEFGLPVVPYSGGTGLVGGQIRSESPAPLVLSLERMNRVRAVYPEEAVLVAEAGAILENVQQVAEEHGLLFPLSMASQGSARIGGNLATNCGGVGVLRYGNARELCLGLEAVMPDGSIWHGLKRLRKDNTGYDLKDLLIGSEGTLGIITAASLRLFPRPQSHSAALMAVPGPQEALSLLAMARAQVGEGISGFELIHRQGLDFLATAMPDMRQPFEDRPEWCVLIDLGLNGGADAERAIEVLFESAFEAELVTDGVIASSEAQRAEFWALRESIPEANRHIGAISSQDVSLPLSALPNFIEEGFEAIAALGPLRVNCFGHVGDGNLHFNVFPPEGQSRSDFPGMKDRVMRVVHDLVHAYDGSISAEHGIGRLKVDDLERYGDPVKLAAMRSIKKALDPKNVMNPGAVLRV